MASSTPQVIPEDATETLIDHPNSDRQGSFDEAEKNQSAGKDSAASTATGTQDLVGRSLSLDQLENQKLVTKQISMSSDALGTPRSQNRPSIERLESRNLVSSGAADGAADMEVVPTRSQSRPSVMRLQSRNLVTLSDWDNTGREAESSHFVKNGKERFDGHGSPDLSEKVSIWAETHASPDGGRVSQLPSVSSSRSSAHSFTSMRSALADPLRTSEMRQVRKLRTITWGTDTKPSDLDPDRAHEALHGCGEPEGQPHCQSNFSNGRQTEGFRPWRLSLHEELRFLATAVNDSASGLLMCCCSSSRYRMQRV